MHFNGLTNLRFRTFVGHTLHVQNRRLALDHFETPGVRVCLMDLKLAARGLYVW